VRDENIWIDRILKKSVIGTLSNVNTTPVVVGLAQLESGPVLTISLEPNSGKKLFISKDCLLCSIDKISSSLLPLQFTITSLMISIIFLLKLPSLLNSFYICEKKPNENPTNIFLQSGSEILVKDLKVGENFSLNSNCLVAFEDSVKLELSTKSVFGNSVWGVNFLKCSGPGKIYFVSQSNKRKSNMRRDAEKTMVPLLSFFGVCLNFIIAILSFYTVTTILSKLSDVIPQLNNFDETIGKAFKGAEL
jgi:hypothetical protein